MKKLVTAKEREKAARRNQLIIGLILVGMMILGTAGYAFMGNESTGNNVIKQEYKGIQFVKDSGYWLFTKDSNNYVMQYYPTEVENISSVGITITMKDYKDETLYITVAPEDSKAEYLRNIGPLIKRPNFACVEGLNCTGDYPIKSCGTNHVIVVREPVNNEDERIYQEGKCVYIVAEYQNQIRYIDAFLYKAIRI